MQNPMKFKCSKCGACCKLAAIMGVMPDRGDGACIHLNEDNECKIYDTRPDFCRVKDEGTDYYILNTKACHEMIDLLGIDEKYKVDIAEYGKDI